MIRRTDELDYVSENNFIFDIDCLQTMKGLDGREVLFYSLKALSLLLFFKFIFGIFLPQYNRIYAIPIIVYCGLLLAILMMYFLVLNFL